jgi:hypothetical protein
MRKNEEGLEQDIMLLGSDYPKIYNQGEEEKVLIASPPLY